MDHSDDPIIKNKKSAKFVLYELVSLDRLKFLRNWYVVTLILFIILILLLGWGGFTAGNTSTQSGGNSPVQGGDLITVNQVNNGYTVSFNKICNSGEILRWSDITSTWECSTETGGVSNTYTSGDGLDLANNQFSVDSPACTFNEKLSWTGTAFVCLPDLVGTGGGVDTDSQTLSLLGNSLTITNGNTVVLPSGVTLINTGNGLTGGPITTTGSISVNAPTCLVSERLSWDGTAFQCLPAALGAGITSINGEGGPAVTLNSTGPISVNTLANTVTYGLTACALNEVYMFDGVSWTCTVTTSLPLTNAFNLDQATGFTSTVNGVVANEALAAGTLTQILGFDVGGNPTFQSASAVVTAATTNVFTTAANVATSTVNGVVSFDDIINSNSLTATLATGFVSSVNGISSTQAIPAGTITNVFGFDVGGAPVNQTVASILSGSTTNAITWTQGAGVTTTVNGVAANVTPGAGVLTNILGYSVGGAPTFESVATVLSSNTTNTLVSAGNTMTSTVNGVASADDIINSNTFTVTQAGGFVSTVNGIAATQAVPAGTLSSLIGFDGGGAVVLQTLASLPCDPSGDFHCQGGNTFGATATTGTLDNQDYEVIANGVRSISVNAAIGTVGIGSHNPTLGILDIDGNVFIRAGGALGWYDSTTTNFVGFQAPAAVPSSFSWTLPATDGTLNQALVTDGASILGWATFLSNAITSINTTATGPNVDLLGTAGQIDITTLGNNVTFSLDPDIVCPGSTTTFCQNGNTFATNGVLGTNDNFDLVLERNNISTAFVSATGFDPMIDNTFDLGTLANRWASLELGPGSLNITSTPGVAGAGANYSSLNQGYPTLDSAVIHTTNFGTNTVGNFGGLTFLSDKNTGLGIQQAFYFSTKQNLAANDEVFQVENDFLGTPDPLFTIMGDGRTGVVNTTPSAMLTVGGGTTGLTGTAGVALIGVAGSPALSVIDEGRIYFDATTDTFRCSENTGAYFDCFGTGVTSLNGESGALTIAGSSPITVSNVGPAFTVALAACATGEVYEYDGANWVCVEESLQYYDESPNAPGVAPSASGTNAVAIGDSATASGNFATAIGWVSTAAGFRSQAFGMANTVGATGTNSHAFGFNNTIDAFDTISVGWSNTSTGAVGENNLFGRSNTASGSQSSLFGTGNASTLGFNNQYAFGRNITNSASNTYSYGNGVNNTVADSLMIGSTAANVITILNTGEMGFGNTDPTSRVDISGAMTMRGMATPALSPLGRGRVYFDSTANEFLCSENNGAYFDCFGGGVQTVTAGLGIINSGTVTNPILDVQVQNGLTIVGDFVEWGGTLLHDTTITNSGFLPTFDSGSLTGTKGLEIIGDLTVTGVIDPIAVMFSDPGIGVLDYQIGITNPANSRPIFVSNSVDRTDAFQVRRSDDTATVLDVDTLNNRVGVGFNNFAPHSTLSTNGSFSVNYEDSSGGSITLDEFNQTVVLTGPAVNGNLPSAAGLSGRLYTIKNESGSTAGVIPVGFETIDGVAGPYALSNFEAVTIISDGVNWHRVGSLSTSGVLTITAGAGLTDSGTPTNPILDVRADNGLQVDAAADRVRLGGAIGSAEATNAALLFNTEIPLAGNSIGWSGQGNFGIGVSTPQQKLHVTSAGDPSNILFEGNFNGVPVPSIYSAFSRMYWAPGRSAFRAGTATGAQWDNGNVGDYSSAFGLDTTASGIYSTAFGQTTTASGSAAVAFGTGNTASGNSSAAFGQNTLATVQGATSFGQNTQANGINSIAAGTNTNVNSQNAVAFGNSNGIDNNSDNVIVGGNTNISLNSPNAAMFGQGNNLNAANSALIIGQGNTASNSNSITSGSSNQNQAQSSITFGTSNSLVNNSTNTILGGTSNLNVNSANAAIFGANQNVLGDRLVVGGQFNQINTVTDSAIFGLGNQVQNHTGSITGGMTNQNASNYSLVAGTGNQVGNGIADFAAGEQNVISAGSDYVGTWGFSNNNQNDYTTAFGNNNNATGIGATAFGNNTTASGDYSTSFGQGTTASGQFSTAFGNNTQATQFGSTAFGFNTNSSGPNSTATGNNTSIQSQNSFTYGNTNNIDNSSDNSMAGGSTNNILSSQSAVVTGQGNTLNGADRSNVFGLGNSLTADNAMVSGSNNTSAGDNSITFGLGNSLGIGSSNTILGGSNNLNVFANDGAVFGFTQTVGSARVLVSGQSHQVLNADDAAVFGQGNQVSAQAGMTTGQGNVVSPGGSQSVVGGGNNTVQATNALVSGNQNTIGMTAINSATWGFSNEAQSSFTTAFGNDTFATGIGATSFGQSTSAAGDYSLAFGIGSAATSTGATAMGEATAASGQNSFAGGFTSTAGGRESFSFGQSNQTPSAMAVAFGLQNISSGTASFVGGNNSTATNDSSFAFGNVTAANANYAVAFGNGTTSQGVASFASGNQATAMGPGSVAMGNGVTAAGDRSTVFGDGTRANGFAQTVIGSFNTPSGTAGSLVNSDEAFIIGNGTSTFATQNAFSVSWDARMTLYGGFLPAVSPLGAGSMYFDIGSNTFRCSENSGAYFDCFGGGSLIGGDGIDITGNTISALADNGLQVDPAADRIRLGGAVGSPEATNASLLFDTEVPLAGNNIGWSGTGHFGIGINTPDQKLHVMSAGDTSNILFEGNFNGDPAPTLFSSTTRMYWAPGRSAFRAGTALTGQWDNANVGDYSTAFGLDNIASGIGSTALGGQQNQATGLNATAWGAGNQAQDINSTAWGLTTIASGSGSTAFGSTSDAQGENTLAFGISTIATGDQSTAWGEDTLALGQAATVFGVQNQANGTAALAFGQNTQVGLGSTTSTAFGQSTLAGTAVLGVNNATAFGLQTSAQDQQATAFGQESTAQGTNSTAFGFSADAMALNSTAFGEQTLAQGVGSTAFGFQTQALGNYGTTFGRVSVAGSQSLAGTAFGTNTSVGVVNPNVENATAFGSGTQAEANQATAFGDQSQALGLNSTAFGLNSEAQADQATAFGEDTIAQGDNSTAFGFQTQALGNTATTFGRISTVGTTSFASTAWGTNTFAGFSSINTENATAFGLGTQAEANQATAFGNQTQATAENATAFGFNSIASGTHSTAFGNSTSATALQSLAFGESTEATANNATAFGIGTVASGFQSTAFGDGSIAQGLNSTAFGFTTLSVGDQSVSWGLNTQSLANNATAFGIDTRADGVLATAWGDGTIASGTASTVFGLSNVALPTSAYSTLWGSQNIASEAANTVWGVLNTATGLGSTVFGIGNITGTASDRGTLSFVNDTYVQTVMGSYAIAEGDNITQTWTEAVADNEQIFIIGNGEDDLSRNTAFYVTWNGDLFFERELRANGSAGLIGDVLLSGGVGGAAAWSDSDLTFWKLGGNQTSNVGGTFDLGTTVNDGVVFITNNTDRMTLTNTGELDISTLTYGGASTDYVCTDAAGNIVVQAGVCNVSSARYKSNITDFTSGLSTVMGLRPVEFTKNSDGSQSLGFIAEEVNAVDPRLAFSRNGQIEGVNYELMSAVLTDAVQTQEGRLQDVEVQSDQNEIKVNAVEASLNTLSGVPTDLQGIRNTILDLQNGQSGLQQTVTDIQNALAVFSSYENRLATIETTLVDVDARIAALEGSISLLQGGSIDLSNLSVGNLIASGNVRVLGKLSVSADTAGVATIPAGLTTVTVTFSTPFDSIPVVTASPIGQRVDYFVANITANSFDITLEAPLAVDVEFNWISLGR